MYDTSLPGMANAACERGRAGTDRICWDNPTYSQVARERGKSRAQQDSAMRYLTLTAVRTPPAQLLSGFVPNTSSFVTKHKDRGKKVIDNNPLCLGF